MSRPLPLVIALMGLASAVAQEAPAPPEIALSAPETEDAKPKVKKIVLSDAHKPAPTPTPAPEARKPAADSSSPAMKSKRVAFSKKDGNPEETPAVEERPLSFWERIFGRRKPKATPAPMISEPTATPKATPRVRKNPKTTTTTSPSTPAPVTKVPSTPKPSTKPAATPKPKSAETAMVKPEKSENVESPTIESAPVAAVPKATPTPRPSPTPRATPAPKKGAKPAVSSAPLATPARKAPVAPAADADAEAQEKYRYEVAKEKALQDPEVLKLKEKADGASTDDEARKAQRAYNKALFNKMRNVDGSIKDRADRIESAIMKRLDAGE